MSYQFYCSCLFFLMIGACTPSTPPTPPIAPLIPLKDSSFDASRSPSIDTTPITNSALDSLEPIWGYRFCIQGDFNGDGQQDTLLECFRDRTTNKETNKYFKGIAQEVDYQYYNKELRQVYTALESTDGSVVPFLRGSCLGFSWLETIGDIDNNGTDEIGYVFYNADMSNLNSFHIYTLKDSAWVRLHSFLIREANFPLIPYHFTRYGLFGADGQEEVQDSSINQQLMAAIDTFQWVKLIKPHVIEFQTMGDPCEIYYKAADKKPDLNQKIWLEATNLDLPPFMSKRWLLLDLAEYSAATQQEILEQLKKGKHEICDPISEFTMRAFIRQNKNF